MKGVRDLQYDELGGFLIFVSMLGVLASIMVLTRTWYASTPRLVTLVSLSISVFNMLGWFWVADDLGDKKVFQDKSAGLGDFLD
jgi:hypothetical protein